MFENLKVIRRLWDRYDEVRKHSSMVRVGLMELRQETNDTLSNIPFVKEMIECDDCGALIIKKSKNKQPSEVITQKAHKEGDIPNEWIKEHYLCGRCQPGGKNK